MRTQDIEAFLAVHKYGSITQAAEKLFVTQPTLSHQISSIEEELGVRLIIRRKGIRTISLTPAGMAFITQAEKLITLFSEAANSLQSSGAESITLSCVQSVLPFIAADINTAFHGLDTPCSFNIRGASSDHAYQKFASKEVEFVICCELPSTPVKGTITTLLLHEPLCFVCRKGGPYTPCVHVNTLWVKHQILANWSAEFMQWQEHWFGSTQKPFMQIRNTSIIEGFFHAPEIWAILPSSIAHSLGPAFQICELDYPPPDRPLYVTSTYPPKEPYHSIILNVITKNFSVFPGVQFLRSADAS